MCVENYWSDWVETRLDPRGDTDGWWASRIEKQKYRAGLKGDVPEWLLNRMSDNMPSHVKRSDRREVRNALKRQFQRAVARGTDFEDLAMETRSSRLGKSRWNWY